jgi:hypothetical protein
VAAAGPGVVFVLDALSFVGVVVVILTWRRERSPSVLPAERMLGAIRAGLRFARHSPALRRVLLRTFLFMVCAAGVMALMPVLGRETGHGAVGFGLLLGSLGIGAVSGAALLPRVRARVSSEALIAGGSIAFALVAIGAATQSDLFLLCPIMLVGGLAWIGVLSTLSVGAQQASPPWVKARALAVYLIVFQAAIAGGSAIWGAVAVARRPSRRVLRHRRRAAGRHSDRRSPEALARTSRITPRHDTGPLPSSPAAVARGGAGHGPGGVQRRSGLRGRLPKRDRPSSAEAVAATAPSSGGCSRTRRTRARFVETWVEETWADHLRNHERVSVAHREIEQRVRDLTRAGTSPATRHFIAPDTRPAAFAAERAVEDRTRALCR